MSEILRDDDGWKVIASFESEAEARELLARLEAEQSTVWDYKLVARTLN